MCLFFILLGSGSLQSLLAKSREHRHLNFQFQISGLLQQSQQELARLAELIALSPRGRISSRNELRKAMDWMIEDLRQSGTAGTVMNVPADGTWYGSVTFRTPVGVSGNDIVWSSGTIQYVLGGGDSHTLQRIIFSGTQAPTSIPFFTLSAAWSSVRWFSSSRQSVSFGICGTLL